MSDGPCLSVRVETPEALGFVFEDRVMKEVRVAILKAMQESTRAIAGRPLVVRVSVELGESPGGVS